MARRFSLVTLLFTALFTSLLIVPPAQAAPSASTTYEQKVLRIINEKRAARGLVKLKPAPCLTNYAHDYARKLDRRNSFVHSDLGRLLRKCNLSYAAENLARVPRSYTPRQTVNLWMNSPGHRANILKKRARLSGLAVVWDRSRNAWVLVHNFGQR